MPRFLRCFFSVLYLQFLGIAVIGSLLWIAGTPSGSTLSIWAMLLGSSLGVSWAVYAGEFIDHRRYVKESHWIHQSPERTKSGLLERSRDYED